jgi:hypothetical protein
MVMRGARAANIWARGVWKQGEALLRSGSSSTVCACRVFDQCEALVPHTASQRRLSQGWCWLGLALPLGSDMHATPVARGRVRWAVPGADGCVWPFCVLCLVKRKADSSGKAKYVGD